MDDLLGASLEICNRRANRTRTAAGDDGKLGILPRR